VDTNDLKKGMIVKSLDKIGLIADVFRNDTGDAKIVFKSAETIVRSPIVNNDSEFIPFVGDCTHEVPLGTILDDIDSIRNWVEKSYSQRVRDGIGKFCTHQGEFASHAFAKDEDSEPFMVHYQSDTRLLLESALGEIKLVFHPRLFKKIEKEKATEKATPFYRDVIEQVIKRLNEFETEVRESAKRAETST